MKSNWDKKSVRLVIIGLVAVASTIMFQNCSKGNLSQLAIPSTSTTPTITGEGGGGGGGTALQCIYSKTLNGASAMNFSVGEKAYGRCVGFSASGVKGCVEIVGSTDGACYNPNSGYTNLPNPASAPYDWKLVGGDYIAEFTIPSSWGGKTFKSFAYDSQTYRSAPTVLLVVAAAPVTCGWSQVTPGAVIGPCSAAPYACTSATVNQTSSVTCGNGNFAMKCVCN